jgi:hypothetical protein
MLARPKLPVSHDEQPRRTGQAQPTEERFLLKVDSQTKRSFAHKENALKAGRAVKKAFPVVAVVVVDTSEGSTEIIGA